MRWGLVLLVLTACESTRYGAYLVIRSDVEIDEVELYFGKAVESSGSGDQFATPMLGRQTGAVFDRRFDASDLVTIDATTETTYYLPPTDANTRLGAYVVAVGLAHGEPVGIAEYFDFTVPSAQVHQYELKLEPYGQQRVERWGAQPGCIAWKRARNGSETIAAVVHEGDRDCDAQLADADCDDLCNAQAGLCPAEQTFCTAAGFCALGCTRAGLCAPTLCLPSITCSSLCAVAATAEERLECGTLNSPEPHFEVYVDRSDAQQICTDKILIKPGVPCTMPMIEVIDPKAVGFFMYTIAQDTDPAQCVVSVTQTVDAKLGDFDNHHMLISVAREGVGPRKTFIMGVQAGQNVGCTSSPYIVDAATDAVFDCGL